MIPRVSNSAILRFEPTATNDMQSTVPATHVDLYQLTSLVPHWDEGYGDLPVTMSFFSRQLPRTSDGRPTRGFLLWAGLRRCVEWLRDARFDDAHLDTLRRHPMLGPALAARPALLDRLASWRFDGRIDAPAEGTPLWAGPAITEDGVPLDVCGVRPAAQTPYLLIDTPLLSIINHMTMIASKAAHVVLAAGGKDVLEFGTRRTHPLAAVDAAYAAWLGGVAGTSSVEAHHRYGVPMLGTMDHFAIQAWERPGAMRSETERAYFEAFHRTFPGRDILLVDTYDTFGDDTGIRSAVAATEGRLSGIRLDSALSRDNIWKARRLLDSLDAPQARIVASGGLDEHAIRALGDAPVDAYGIGERIVTSPDAPVGVGAVGKLCARDGVATMKLSRGSGKATLPGRVQVFRDGATDRVAIDGETLPGRPLLGPVWDESGPIGLPRADEVRAHALASIAALPDELKTPRETSVRVSRALEASIRDLVRTGLAR